MRAFTRRNLTAIVVGVLLVGAAAIVLDFWLSGLIDRQGKAQVDIAAHRAVALADSRLTMTIEALDGLAARGVGSCQPDALEAMRQAAFRAIPVKEISVLGPNGQVLCTHLGPRSDARTVENSEPLKGVDGYNIEVMRLPDGQPIVRLRRGVPGSANSIAALVPSGLFLPQVTLEGNPFKAYVEVKTSGGASLAVSGPRFGDDDTNYAMSTTSDKFGTIVEVTIPRAMLPSNKSGLRWIGLTAIGIVVSILAMFLRLMPRQRNRNPVTDLENALAAGEFVPYYQPIVDIRSGQLRGAEVLVRWRKPDGSLVLPGAFIPLAESSGLIAEMTRDLMRRVCGEAGAAIGRRPALKISFNFAGQLFSDPNIVKDVRKIFTVSPIKLTQVVLEVTERDPIQNFTVTRQTIAALQELGVRIAIDDVGTGHSGLSYMLKLGVDIIKIDKMFVDAIGTDRNSTTIVETLVDLAHNMRMDVVAEGVENFEQVMHLRELGVRSAQGYVFAPPLPGSSFLQLIEALDPLQQTEAQPAASLHSRFSAA